MGRDALDAEAIRLIEQHHPHIRFDWPQILNGEEEVLPPEPPPRRPEREQQPAQPVAALPEVAESSAPLPAPEPLPPPDEPLNPVHGRLGVEGLARLRSRYLEIASGIERRTPDEERRRALLEQAMRLNPDAWLTDEDVARGLEDYESVLASLREVVGRRRRRKRGRSGGPGAPGGESPSPSDQDQDEEADPGPPGDGPESQ